MSEQKWTSGLLNAFAGAIRNEDKTVIVADTLGSGLSAEEAVSNSRRLADCWNFLAGHHNLDEVVVIAKGELEDYSNLSEQNVLQHADVNFLQSEIAELRAVNAELLAALQEWKAAENYGNAYHHLLDAQDDITSAWEGAVAMRDAVLAKVTP